MADGCRWRWHTMAHMTFRKASSADFPARVRMAHGRLSSVWRSTRSRAARSMPPSQSWWASGTPSPSRASSSRRLCRSQRLGWQARKARALAPRARPLSATDPRPGEFHAVRKSGAWMPAAAALTDLAFLLQARQYAVEVVLLDSHLRGELGNGDAGLPFYEGQCLCGTRAAAFAPTRAPAGGWTAWFAGCFARRFGGGRSFGAHAGAGRASGPATAWRRGG